MNDNFADSAEEKIEKTIVDGAQPKQGALKPIFPKALSENPLQRYKILRTVEEDSVESIKYAQDNFLQREVVLRTFQMPDSPTKMQQIHFLRFTTEAKVTGLLEHPNILPLYDKKQLSEKRLYFTLRKISGKTLEQLLIDMENDTEVFDQNRLVTIYLKVCDAISYTHSQGYAHQNLSLKNIIIGEYGEVYIRYWGLAGNIGQIQEDQIEWFQKNTNGLVHIAPEQRDTNNRTKAQSDIYALGVLLKSCFFRGIPTDIGAIILTATQPQWSKRYASVEEIIEDVENYSKNLTVSVREYSLIELLSKWIARNVKVFISALLVIFVVVFIFLKTSAENQQQLESQFKAYFEQAKGELKKYSTNNSDSFFLARNSLKSIISFTNNHFKEVEADKLALLYHQIGKPLLEITCDSQAYSIAKGVAYFFENTPPIKQQALQLIDARKRENQTQQEKKQKMILARYQEFKQKLKENLAEVEDEEKTVESLGLSLKDNEVFFVAVAKELQALTQEKLQQEELLYRILIRAFAETEKPAAKMIILNLFERFVQYLSTLLPEEITLSQIEFLVALIQGINSCYTISSNEPLKNQLKELYSKFKEEEIFATKTKKIYQKLE